MGRKILEVCGRGHKLKGDNLYIRKDGRGRNCKACANIRQAEYYKADKMGYGAKDRKGDA